MRSAGGKGARDENEEEIERRFQPDRRKGRSAGCQGIGSAAKARRSSTDIVSALCTEYRVRKDVGLTVPHASSLTTQASLDTPAGETVLGCGVSHGVFSAG